MKYVTITSSSYEEALKKAEDEYGKNIRVHSRRDYFTGGGLFSKKKSKCDLTIYFPEGYEKEETKRDDEAILEFEKEAHTPNPDDLKWEERVNTEVYRGSVNKLEKAEKILTSNDITEPLRSLILTDFNTEHKTELEIANRILDSVLIKQRIDNKYIVLLGPTGSGKTTTCAKMAINLKKEGKNVFIISLDSYRVGSFYQIEKLTSALNIKLRTVKDEAEFNQALTEAAYYDIILIDTMGLSKTDDELNLKLRAMLHNLNRSNSEFIYIASATTKEEDLNSLYEFYSSYIKIDSMVASKVDECSTIGTLLSFSFFHALPFTYITNGQRVPEDIAKAESLEFLKYLKELDLDLSRFESQV